MVSVVEIDLHEWLPAWGENQVTTRSVSGDFFIDITYDKNDGSEETLSLAFSHSCFYSVGSFPGVENVGFEFDYTFETGKVLEIINSGLANAWKEYWASISPDRQCRHFVIFFGSENRVVHVVASFVTVR